LFNSIKGITYQQLVDKLRHRYGTTEQHEKFRLELKFRRKKFSETLQELPGAVEKLAQLAFQAADMSTRHAALARDGFTDALDDRQLQSDIRRQSPVSLDAALALAMKLDVVNKGSTRDNDQPRPRFLQAVTPVEEGQEQSPTPVKSSTEPTRGRVEDNARSVRLVRTTARRVSRFRLNAEVNQRRRRPGSSSWRSS